MRTKVFRWFTMGGVGCAAGLSLVWWLNATPTLPMTPRLPLPTEGPTQLSSAFIEPTSHSISLEGIFESHFGKPGTTSTDWPRFRGGDFNNIQEQSLPLASDWNSSTPQRLWSISLGEGHAGPAVWRGRVYVLDYDEERQGDRLRCISFADGADIWSRFYHAPTKRNHGVSRTVPAIADGVVVTMGPRCHVLCVEAETGDFLWGKDLVGEYAAQVPLWYTGQCPLIDEGIAVLAPGGTALMIGVDCQSGEVVWKTPNPKNWQMSHSSIIPMRLAGRRMYVYCAKGGVIGVSAEPEDRGKLLWEFPDWNRSIQSPSPVQVDDQRIFITAGYGGGSMMLSLRMEGGTMRPELEYVLETDVFACEQQTPILYRNHLFGILPKDAGSLRGQMVCLDLQGKMVWSSGMTERFGLGPFLVADDKIFILNDTGELTLIRASIQGYEKLASATILNGRDAWGPMALVDGRLLLRDDKTLICLDVSAATHDGGTL